MTRRPQPPAHLDDAARAKWGELVGSLQDQEQGTLDALAAYCSAWSRWTAAESKVAELGTVVKSPQGFPVANPYAAIAAQAQRQMRQWAGELRLTPAARAKGQRKQAKTALQILTSKGRTG